MRLRGGILAVGAVLAIAPAAVANPARSAAPTSVVTSIPVHVTGALSVQFHGDASAGCARWGLCGYSGTVTWQPAPHASLQIDRAQGPTANTVTALLPSLLDEPPFFDGETTASVQRTGPGSNAPVTRCADATGADQAVVVATHHGRANVGLSSAVPSLLATRCAGPRAVDVIPHIPVRNVALAALAHGRTRISLATAQVLHAHGLSGSITSTIALDLGRPGRPRTERDVPSGGGRVGEVEVDYRATLSGSVVEQVRGIENPLDCTPLDSCGLTGTIVLRPRAQTTDARLVVDASSRTPRRELLAAAGLVHGTAGGLKGLGTARWRGGGTVSADLVQGDTRCRDVAPLGPGAVVIVTYGTHWEVGMPGEPASALTRCPGPVASAGLGATAPRATLDRRTARIVLTSGSTFTDDGYRVRVMPHLTVTLTRLRVRVRTIPAFSDDFFSG